MRHGCFPASLLVMLVICGFAFTSVFGVQDPKQEAGGKSEESVGGFDPNGFTLVVMDPLAAPLACDCVQGYAQRKYELLGELFSKRLGRPVNVVFGETVQAALEETQGAADLVIGKHSVVLAGAKAANKEMLPVARLTGKDDSVDQTGLLVVRSGNAAKSVADLAGYRVFFGPPECDEKHAAPIALLREHGVEVSAKAEELETCSACSVAAKKLMELGETDKAVAVISSYAEPLLEGCGNIKKGDLRIVGVSKPVPFITAFVNGQLSESARAEIVTILADVELDATLLTGLETGSGFQPWEDGETAPALSPSSDSSGDGSHSDTAATGKKKN